MSRMARGVGGVGQPLVMNGHRQGDEDPDVTLLLPPALLPELPFCHVQPESEGSGSR